MTLRLKEKIKECLRLIKTCNSRDLINFLTVLREVSPATELAEIKKYIEQALHKKKIPMKAVNDLIKDSIVYGIYPEDDTQGWKFHDFCGNIDLYCLVNDYLDVADRELAKKVVYFSYCFVDDAANTRRALDTHPDLVDEFNEGKTDILIDVIHQHCLDCGDVLLEKGVFPDRRSLYHGVESRPLKALIGELLKIRQPLEPNEKSSIRNFCRHFFNKEINHSEPLQIKWLPSSMTAKEALLKPIHHENDRFYQELAEMLESK